MTKQKEKKEVDINIDFEKTMQKFVDNGSASSRQSRWTDLLLAAIEARHVSTPCRLEFKFTDILIETLKTRLYYACQPSFASRSTAMYSATSTSTPTILTTFAHEHHAASAWCATATVLETRGLILDSLRAFRRRCTSDCSPPAARPTLRLSRFCGQPTFSASRTAGSCCRPCYRWRRARNH